MWRSLLKGIPIYYHRGQRLDDLISQSGLDGDKVLKIGKLGRINSKERHFYVGNNFAKSCGRLHQKLFL